MAYADFFTGRSTQAIAQDLLGRPLLYHSPAGLVGGWIVETEAYLGQADNAAHAYQGHRSPANEALYGPPGTIYIYERRGLFMCDIAVQAAEVPQGVLLRGIQPVWGIDIMQANRAGRSLGELTNGPGKLFRAFGVRDKSLNLHHLATAPLTVVLADEWRSLPRTIADSARVGVRAGGWHDRPYRFYVAGNPWVSKTAKRSWRADHGWAREAPVDLPRTLLPGK
ncbi:DNA-3-methyladenine glycosylase [Schleiferilactobacillus shenzhenensis]|uniref:Putative 3-methyladenine DNA glycosylase n=1 Tax=Schleiferilactobacillus shenzhenensis LY-73 TaxID=1231336 RepID=U4TVH7_9LACO|nr:DNA-3-methyladenine glycosylase [Schleiferilactobacillus shenzhenensis]ERL65392.1 Putative 3-methyladenine DNA glycosylase [Schleiferilactobacillus shenzhenensis LY-73]